MSPHVIFFATVFLWSILQAEGITKTRDTDDVLNLNGIQDGEGTVQGKGLERKDGTVTENQENRSFFKPPDSDRRGTFYPSGPPGSGVGPNFHTSGNGFSYGAPSGGQFPSYDGTNYPRPPGGGGSYGAGLGGTYGLAPSGQGGPIQGNGGPAQGHGFGHGGGGGGGDNHKAIALKSLIGVALLGAAAVLAKTHPVLLQLGVLSGKKRRRRSLDLLQGVYPHNPYLKPAKRTKRIDNY